MADVLRKNPDFIQQLALCLDREMRLIPNWKHFSWELKVDANVITRLEQYSDFSPTIRLFEYLEVTQPDLTIQQLKQALLEIKRNDLVKLLTTEGNYAETHRSQSQRQTSKWTCGVDVLIMGTPFRLSNGSNRK